MTAFGAGECVTWSFRLMCVDQGGRRPSRCTTDAATTDGREHIARTTTPSASHRLAALALQRDAPHDAGLAVCDCVGSMRAVRQLARPAVGLWPSHGLPFRVQPVRA